MYQPPFVAAQYAEVLNGPVWSRLPDGAVGAFDWIPSDDDVRREIVDRLAPLDVIPLDSGAPTNRSLVTVGDISYVRDRVYIALSIESQLVEAGAKDEIRSIYMAGAALMAEHIKAKAETMRGHWQYELGVVVRPLILGMMKSSAGCNPVYMSETTDEFKTVLIGLYFLTAPGDLAADQ